MPCGSDEPEVTRATLRAIAIKECSQPAILVDPGLFAPRLCNSFAGLALLRHTNFAFVRRVKNGDAIEPIVSLRLSLCKRAPRRIRVFAGS